MQTEISPFPNFSNYLLKLPDSIIYGLLLILQLLWSCKPQDYAKSKTFLYCFYCHVSKEEQNIITYSDDLVVSGQHAFLEKRKSCCMRI